MYAIFKLAKTKGMLAIESHIERPEESSLFQAFPKFSSDHHALEFLCDYLRMMTLGTDNPHELADLLDEELETHHAEDAAVAGAYQTMGDGFPALGIVAAVLGIIKTMGSITEPPEVLGKLIGGALVGTFLGILLAYGFVSPLAATMGRTFEADAKYLGCIKAGLLAHVSGYAPAVSVEFARKTLLSKDRPSFFEVEEAVAALPPV
jgi:chemotaxis protein MotA